MKTVLVVEDNKDNLSLITYTLNRAGYEVRSAETGEEGVRRALLDRPYFIIMDINLPGIDGFEAARRIRESPSNGDIPIIAITSYAMRGDMEKIMNAGFSGYFEKPIDPLTIMDHIHEVLRGLKKKSGEGHEDPDR